MGEFTISGGLGAVRGHSAQNEEFATLGGVMEVGYEASPLNIAPEFRLGLTVGADTYEGEVTSDEAGRSGEWSFGQIRVGLMVGYHWDLGNNVRFLGSFTYSRGFGRMGFDQYAGNVEDCIAATDGQTLGCMVIEKLGYLPMSQYDINLTMRWKFITSTIGATVMTSNEQLKAPAPEMLAGVRMMLGLVF